MSKLFKRLLCLLLGIVMGISATVGSIATSVYYLYGNLTIADVLPDDKDRLKDALGDLGDYSAEDVIALFSKALKAPQNYTIADLEREYGFNLVDLINQAAGSDVIDTKNPDNKPYVDDLKSVSLFALLSGQVNVTEFLSDIPLGAVMSFVPSDTVLDNEQREKLRKYSIGSLAAKDETTGTPVAVSALSELTIGGILPGIFEKSGDKYIVKDGKPDALGLIANLKLGGFVSPLTGATTIGDELVSGGLSALGELSLGEIYRTVGVNDENDVAGTLDGLFTDSEGNPIKLRDLFAKDISSGNDSYVFVVDKLLDSIRFGTLFGMTRKDGEWVVKKDDGTEEKATGLLKFLANLNLTDVYHALTDAATTKDRIHKIILIFGDLSVGDVFETLGYSKDEDGRWVKPDGSRLKSRVAEALLDFSIRDIVGEASSELSFDQIRKNVVGAISGLCDDMTIGEGFGELFGVAAANGKYFDPETGNPVNEAIARILDIKIRDITDCFAKDKINVDEIYGVFEKAIAGVYVGAILGAERIDGEWYANGGKVTDALAMLYNVRLEGLFSVIKELQNPDGFSYSEIIKGFLPEACVGDILCAVSGMTRHNVGDSAYFTDANGSPVGEGLNKLLRLRLWQIAAGFDKNGNFDLKAVLDEIKVGDALDAVYDADKNEWTLLDRTAKGGLAEIMNVSLGLLVSGDTEKINDTLTGDAKNVSLGDVLTFALAYKDGKILNSDAELNEFAQKFIEWNAPTVNYVEDLVKNKDFEKLRNDINAQFGALKIGEAFRPYLVSKNDEGKYVFSALEQISGIVEPIFNTDFKVVVDIIFDLIAGKSVDFGKILTDIYGSLTIGEVIAPIVGLSLTDGTAQVEAGKKVYVTNNGNGTSLGLGVTALMKTSIFGLVQSVIDGVNNKDGKNLVHRLLGTTEEKGAIDIDHVLGEYIYSFLKLDYDGKDWTNGDGKTYAPITTLLNANLYEIIDHVLDINKAYTADEKKDYFIGILDDLTIKDILSFSKEITESDKALVQKVGDVKLVRFVVDLIEKNDRIAVIKESGFGKVAIGDLVQLAVDIKQDATGWKKSDGEYFACMISDAFSLDVNKIFEITDDIKAGGDNVVTEVFNKVFPERRVGDFVNVLIPSLSDDCTRGNYKTWGTNKAAGDLPLVLSDVFNLKFKTFFDALLGEKKSAVDIVLTITDEIFGDPVNNHPEHASWARSFNDYMKDFGLTYLDEHKAFDDIKDVKVGEFIYHVLKDKDPAAYLEGLVNNISLGDIAELPLGEEGVQKLPLVARDLCDVLVGDIIQIVKGGEKLKANICATIDKVTKSDAEGHRFGDYLDDLLKGKASESIIKTNEGLKGITDIKISELVKVILKQTTVEMKTDGTLAKMGVSDKLPEGLKNIIIYICDNITDNALIGDFLINGANGYRKEANGDGYIWYDSNGKACEDILNTVYSLETSYVLYLIGGIYIVATEPDTVMQEVLKLKAGTIVMPIYNLMLEKAGEYASKMTCSDTKEESEKVYEIKGLYKDLLTKLSNMTLGEIKDEVQTRPMWIAEYFYNRELGDLLYDALSMTVGKTLGIEGFAYEHKGPDGYTTDNKVLTAVFNFNVKSMLDATDKTEYILGIFGEVRVGDLVNLVSNKITYDENIGLWVNGTQTAKYIVNDLFNITANNVTEWVKTIKAGIVEDVIRLIVADVTVNRTLDDYLSDIGNATVDRIIANGAFDKIAREETLIQVTDVVLNNLKNKKYVDLITYYFGDIRVGDVANIVKGNIKYDANIGLWVNGTQTAKYIVNDLLNITANNVTEWVKAIKAGIVEDVIRLIVADVTVNRTLDDYLSDIGNATVDRIIANGAFDKIAREETLIQVTDVVLNNLKNKKYVDLITYYFGDIRVGDVANVVNGNIKYDANIGLWVNGTQTAKYIVSDLFDIGVNAVKEVAEVAKNGGSAEKVVKKAAEKLFKTRTLEDYLLDIGNANVTKVVEKAIFDQLMRKESVVQIINYVLDRIYYKDYAGIAEHYLGEAKLGAVAEFVNGIKAPAAEGEKWTYKNGGIPYVLGDAMDLTFADVIGMFAAKSGETLPTWQNRIATLVAKYTKNDLRTLKTYIEDLAGKSLNVKGLADLSDIRIAELVSVALKVNAEEIKADEGGTLDKLGATNDLPASVKNLVIYVCNVTDKILIGDYLTQLDNPEGGVHRDADGKWFNKTTEVTGLLKTIYGLPTTYLFGAVVAVVKPQLVIDAVGGYKIGKLIRNPYNNALRSLESSIGETNGEYYAEGSFKAVVDTFVNLTVNDILADIKAGTFVDGLEAKFILDRKLGDYLFDLISILAKKTNKSGYGIKGYAYESVNAEDLYETSGNFKKIYDIVLNIKFKEDLFDQKSNVLVHLKEMFQTLYLGDLFYDVLRSVSKSKLCEGYGFENFEENIGYKLDKQFADVLGAVFNVQLLDINNCIGKDFTARFKNLLKVKFGELTVGDFGYDLFAKYLATKLSLKANGYAYEFKADNTMLKGKAAKVVAATFNISLNDIDALMKNYSAASGKAKNTAIINFVIDTYGTLTVGDVLGAIVEKLTATKLQMTYTYDEDYNLTVTDNFKEIANIIFSSSSGDLLRAIRANKVKAYFLGDQKGTTDGLVGGLNLGDVLGYALKAKAFKGFVKNTDIERNETTGKWEIARSFSHPLSILCNDVTISGLLRKINEPKQFIIDTLGDVCVGEMLGKYLVDDVWYKADGTVEDVSAENGGVIMKHVYGIKLGELLGEGFNINKILGDVYVGELIGYAHCGKKYTKTEGEHTQYNVCTEETHTDNADGYHVHADECNVTGHTETTHKTGWYKKDGETYVEIDAVASVMADLRLGYVLGNPNMKLADLFGDLKLGDVLGYAYCDNAGTGKCTVTGHTAHDGKFTWYVKNGGTYSVAGALETALADVKMKDILDGNFDINEVIGDIYIGELMGYTYCDHAAGGKCTVTGHTETTHDAELTWYKKNGETPAALENALAGVRLKEILDGNFDINGVIADIYVGELIGYDYCGKKYTKTEGEHTQYNVCTEETHTDNADGYHIHADECTLGHSETSHEAGWYKKNAAGVPEKVGVVEGVMADIRLGYILGNGDVKFGDMFGSLKLGDVLGYDYCDMEGTGATNKCTVEGHTSATHDKVKTLTWYVKESAGYRMANAIERTLANVPMKDVLNGTFNVDDTLNTLKLGNLMNYEYCDGVGDACMIDHDEHTAGWYKNTAAGWEMISHEVYCDGEGKHCGVVTHDHMNPPTTGYAAGWYHYDAKSGKWIINEDGKHTGNNILLCMIGRSVNDSRGSNFTTELVNDINNYVLIGDIYDMTAVTGPINLISPNTKLGDISHAMAGVMSKATAKELNENGLLPVSATTTDRMSEVYGAVIFVSVNLNPVDWTYTWKDPETDSDAIVPKSGTTVQADKAIADNAALKPTATPGTAEYDEQLKAYEKAIGRTYWESLTIDQLVDVLLLSARV